MEKGEKRERAGGEEENEKGACKGVISRGFR